MFGFSNMCGWQPSLLLHDLTNGTQQGSMNLRLNQVSADMQARQNLYMTPVMDWGCFSAYNTPGSSMSYLADPSYTIGQWMWNNYANTGLNNLSGWGNMGNMGWNNNGWGNMGWNGGAFPGAGNSNNSTASTPEERIAQKKYNKLLSLVKQLASADNKIIPPARKEALEEIATHPVGKTWAEKLENLQAEYKKVGSSAVKEFITSKAAEQISVNGTNGAANSFYGKLQSIGYELKNTKVDAELRDFYDAISSIRDEQEKYSDNEILSHLEANDGTYDILDVVSSWNTKEKDSTKTEEKRIIDFIKKGYDALPSGKDGDGVRNSVKTGVIKPIVYALIDKANGLQENLDSDSQTAMKNAIDKLEKSYRDTNAKVDSNMSKAFDELYILTRKAAVAILAAEITDYYGTVDPDLFNNDLFKQETIDDLKEEGFKLEEINKTKINVPESQDSGDYSRRIDETKSAQEQVNELVSQGNLAKAKDSDVKGLTGDVYYDKNTKKVYVIKDNADGEAEIHEVENVKANNGKIDVTGTPKTKVVSSNDIQEESKTAKKKAEEKAQAVKEAKAQKVAVQEIIKDENILKPSRNIKYNGKTCPVYKEQSGNREFILKPDGFLYELNGNNIGKKIDVAELKTQYAEKTEKTEGIKGSYSDGKYVFDKIDGISDSTYYSRVNEKIANLNKDTVLGFVQGYYDKKSQKTMAFLDSEGMIEHLDDEDNGATITMDAKKNLINSFLEKAKELGFEHDEDYEAIKEIMSYYESGQQYEFSTTFNNNNGGILDGFGTVGAVAGFGAGVGAAYVGASLASGPIGWAALGLGAVCAAIGGVADRQTDNEVIDRCMYSLMKKMQEKCPKEFHKA